LPVVPPALKRAALDDVAMVARCLLEMPNPPRTRRIDA